MQEMNPAIISDGIVQTLETVPQKDYTESYIQELIFKNPNLLKLNEIDVSCGKIAPLCREFPVDSSGHSIDDLYVDSNGVITIVECKLIRNHQATREVLGQILDYAKEIVKFNYKELERIITKITNKKLFELVSERIEWLDQEAFEENVNRNLKEGRINLIIAGDRISRNVEELVTFLNGYTKMSFKIGVVEIQLYKLPESDKRIAIPNCLFKTVEYRLVRLGSDSDEEDNIIKPQDKIELFYEKIQKNTGQTSKIKSFVDDICTTYNLIKVVGRGERISLNIKTENEENNLLSISDNGKVSFYGLTTPTLPETKLNIGKKYIKTICELVGADFEYDWGVYPKIKNTRLNIETLLKYQKSVKLAIEEYIKADEKLQSI